MLKSILALRYYIVLFVLAFIISFVVKFPASSALVLGLGDAKTLNDLNIPVDIQSISGTIWYGNLRGRATVMEQTLPVKAHWDFKWLSLFTLNPKAEISLASLDSQLIANISLSTDKIDIRNAKGALKPGLLNSLLGGMNINVSEALVVEFLDLHIDENKNVVDANAKLTWLGGETKYPDATKRVQNKLMNPLDLIVTDENNVLRAKLMPKSDSTQVVGSAAVDLNNSAQFEITPRLLEYQGISFPKNAKRDLPIFSQEILLSDN